MLSRIATDPWPCFDFMFFFKELKTIIRNGPQSTDCIVR